MIYVYIFLSLTLSRVGLGSLQDKQTDFGLRIISKLSQKHFLGKNIVLSPYGVASTLAMAQLGAAGRTRTALASAMGFSLLERGMSRQQRLLQWDLSSVDGVETVSGVMVERTMKLEKRYRRILAKAFNTHPHQVDFAKSDEAVNIINSWVSDNTAGTIPDFLESGSLNEETRLVLLNALHFQALWKVPFDPKMTVERMFHCGNRSTIPVQMMRLTNYFNYGEFVNANGIDYEVIEVPYEDDSLSMLLVSPTDPDVPLSMLIEDLSSHMIQQWRRELRRVKKQLSMPMFTLDFEVDLKNVLIEMGLANIFNLATADFTHISADERLCVSEVRQRVKIEVNERGTKGATATAALMFSRMAVDEMTLDQPFIFLIQHKQTGALLFIGQFNHPQQQ